jgi:hypothetical protein
MQNVLVTAKGKKDQIGARLFPIFARRSHTAVVFRRGPSKWVQVIRWNTKTDAFELGQWFHGRIYELRCDLSPDGSLLVYFAQKISARSLKDKEYTYAWTAISKPPYLTALALWPKGDCWNGGGLFESDKKLLLYHLEKTKPHPDHKPPGWLHVSLAGCGRGEDDPLFDDRLQRDGWLLKREWQVKNLMYPKWYQTTQPEVREKTNRKGSGILRLTRSIQRLRYSEEFLVLSDKGAKGTPISRASWADWDQSGRLVFCKEGKVFAAQVTTEGLKAKELADFNSSRPEPLPPSRAATIW